MLKQDYDKLMKDRLKRRAYKRARRIRIYSFLYRKNINNFIFNIIICIIIPNNNSIINRKMA